MKEDRIQGIISMTPRTLTVQLPQLDRRPLKRLSRQAAAFTRRFHFFKHASAVLARENKRRPPISHEQVEELLNRLRSY